MKKSRLLGTACACGLTNTGPFIDLMEDLYWSSTELDSVTAWRIFLANGGLDESGKNSTFPFAWAVHDGDVGTAVVPLPASAWLFGSGMLGLIGLARRKAT